MNAKEINCYMNGFEEAFIKIMDIISNHVEKVSDEMIRELENYSKSVRYEADAMLDNACQQISN